MKTSTFQSLLLSALMLTLSTSAQAQERSYRSHARSLSLSVSENASWRPGTRRPLSVGASGYRGTYGRARSTRFNLFTPRRTWVPGHYEQVATKVFVPKRIERVWVPAVYETRYDHCGTPYQMLVCKGYFKEVCRPAHYETRFKKRWIAGHYETVRGDCHL